MAWRRLARVLCRRLGTVRVDALDCGEFYALEPMYYAAHHVLDLIRTGLFAVLLVLTAALWRGWRQSRCKTK
ncbi:MAG: hypothetical protein ACLR77_13390 [Oscillospiraceae bacterium]